jgi:hypothetical protein
MVYQICIKEMESAIRNTKLHWHICNLWIKNQKGKSLLDYIRSSLMFYEIYELRECKEASTDKKLNASSRILANALPLFRK